MEDHNCEYHEPWPTAVWLLLTVISNANGALLTLIHVDIFPWSWIFTVVYIMFYRLIFINGPMPIIVDLGFSLLLQYVSSFGDFGWKLACSIAILSNAYFFISLYLIPLLKDYWTVKDAQPDSETLIKLIHPLSRVTFTMATWQTFCLNGVFLILIWATWFYLINDELYHIFQVSFGIILIVESFIFLWCYNQMKTMPAVEKDSIQGSGGTTRSARRRAKRDGRKL